MMLELTEREVELLRVAISYVGRECERRLHDAVLSTGRKPIDAASIEWMRADLLDLDDKLKAALREAEPRERADAE